MVPPLLTVILSISMSIYTGTNTGHLYVQYCTADPRTLFDGNSRSADQEWSPRNGVYWVEDLASRMPVLHCPIAFSGGECASGLLFLVPWYDGICVLASAG